LNRLVFQTVANTDRFNPSAFTLHDPSLGKPGAGFFGPLRQPPAIIATA
jgi:hypothetical protein